MIALVITHLIALALGIVIGAGGLVAGFVLFFERRRRDTPGDDHG